MSAVPTVVDALYDALSGAWALSDTQVLDGPSDEEVAPDVLLVGYSADGPSAESTQVPVGLRADRESVDVYCVASSWAGGSAVRPRRARVFDIVAHVRSLLAADKTLGGAVANARITAMGLTQELTTKGAVATVEFTVHVDAFH